MINIINDKMDEIKLVRESFSKKVNEEVVQGAETIGDAQYIKDLQMITVKYNKDLQILNDNIAKFKQQAMNNYLTRQKAAQQKSTAPATTTQPAASTTPQTQGTQPAKNESLLEMVDDNYELNERGNPDSILIPREIEDTYDDDSEYIEPEEEETERDSIEDDDEWEEENLVFYLRLDDHGDPIVAKLYREEEDADWIINVVQGSNSTLNNMAFYHDYDKVQIMNYLADIFDDVEELTERSYNKIIGKKNHVNKSFKKVKEPMNI